MTPEVPTPTRQVVVVRQGPPKRRGIFVDGIVGVLGVALLVVAGVLGQTLPEDDVIAEQFLPEFPTTTASAKLYRDVIGGNGSQSIPYQLVDGEEVRILVVIPHDNVVSISMQAHLPGDDIGSSLPDAFSFTLLDPDGNQVGEVFKANTAQPKQRPATLPTLPVDPGTVENVTKPMFISGETLPATSWRLGAPPEAEVIGAGERLDRTVALSMAIDKYRISTNGTWTLVVKLTNAGDCPPASPSGQNDRYQECMRATTGPDKDPDDAGKDLGNAITVKYVQYNYYTITLPDPKAEQEDAI